MLLRLVRALPEPTTGTLRAVGVDEIALRRGHPLAPTSWTWIPAAPPESVASLAGAGISGYARCRVGDGLAD